MTRRAGFTLMEVLAALVVLGLVVAMLSQGTRFGFDAARRQTRQTDQVAELEAAARTIRWLIEHAAPPRGQNPSPFRGSEQSIALRTELPLAAGSQSERRIDALLAVDAQHRLVLRWVPYVHAVSLGPPPPQREAVLVTGLDRLAIRYWGQPDAKTPPAWFGGWFGSGPPRVIRVGLVFPPRAHRHWPDVIAIPREEAARE